MPISSLAHAYEARWGDVIKGVRDVLRRRYAVLAVVVVAVTALGTASSVLVVPRYQGVARIQIDPTRDPLAHKGTESQGDLAAEAIETHVSAIGSRNLARAVVIRLGLVADPEVRSTVDSAVKSRSIGKDAQIDLVANTIASHLSVEREKLSYVIDIRYTSINPRNAALIANEFAVAYMNSMVNSNIGTAQTQSSFFQGQLNQMAADARDADAKVAQFEAKTGVISKTDGAGSITDQQIGPLAATLAGAEGFAAQARAKAASARQSVATGRFDTIADVRQSQTIIDLKAQRAALMQTLAEMDQRYGDAYPDLIKVKGQVSAIDQQLGAESKRVIASLDAESSAATAQAASLQASMQDLKNRKSSEAESSVMLQSLQRDADSKHAAYDRMAQTTMDSRQASQASFAQVQIIDPARIPDQPYFPKLSLMIGLSLVAGIGLGFMVIAWQEVMASGLTSVQEIEGDLGLTLIAAIPRLRKTPRPADILTTRPTSPYAEALRNARATIMGVKGDHDHKIIAITSALPDEGKTTTALALARTMAINGGHVLIIDVDVRRAQLNALVSSAEPGAGLVEVLSGNATLDDAIKPTDVVRLDIIGVRKPHFTPDNLFGTVRWHTILDELSRRYQTIILDLPPLIGLADGRILAAFADAVVLIVKWNETPVAAVKSAVHSLQSDGANLVGVMYSMVEANAQMYGTNNDYTKYYLQP